MIGTVLMVTAVTAAAAAWARRRREGASGALPQKGTVTAGPNASVNGTFGDENGPADAEEENASPRNAQPAGFSVHLGDIVMLQTREDLLLTSVWVFDEGAPWGALFFGPSSTSGMIFAPSAPTEKIALLHELPESFAPPATHVPPTLEWSGQVYRAARRLPLHARALGETPRPVNANAILHEYNGDGTRVLLLIAQGTTCTAFEGTWLHAAQYEVVTSG